MSHHHPDSIEPFPPPLDDCARNQLREFNEEGLHDWRREMTRRLDVEHPHWRSMFENVEEAADVLLGESPYGEY